MTVQSQVTPDVLARMDGIVLHEHTLGQLVRAWLDAGITLGHKVNERARLMAAVAKNGLAAPEINMTKVRSLWIRSMHAMQVAIELIPLSPQERESLLAPIVKIVAEAERRRRPEGEESDEGSGEGNESAPDPVEA